MKVRKLKDHNDASEQSMMQIDNEDKDSEDSILLWGWINEKGIIFFCEYTPKFDPHTGEKLEVIESF